MASQHGWCRGRPCRRWLPSLGYLPGGPAALAGLNAHIDEAAAEAGRDPAAIGRLLNISGQFGGTSQQWAEELAGPARDYGVTGFIIATDDAATIETFVAEIAPAVRAALSP